MIKILSSSESSSNLLTFIKKVKKSDKKLFKKKYCDVGMTLIHHWLQRTGNKITGYKRNEIKIGMNIKTVSQQSLHL